jgi:superfamily II DNA or RNA helicase
MLLAPRRVTGSHRSAVQCQQRGGPSRFLGEGFDGTRLDTLFLALPISSRGTLAHYAGRLYRMHAPKREVVLYDYLDENEPVLAMMTAKTGGRSSDTRKWMTTHDDVCAATFWPRVAEVRVRCAVALAEPRILAQASSSSACPRGQ